MTVEEQPPLDAGELWALVQEQRRLIEELQEKLGIQPTPAPERSWREARIAQSELRRAARQAERAAAAISAPWVAQPPVTLETGDVANPALLDLAAARRYISRRSNDAEVAIQQGDYVTARIALGDMLSAGRAIQQVVEGIELPSVWRELRDQLLAAGDTVIEGLEEELIALENEPVDLGRLATGAAHVLDGEAAWRRAWRGFLMVAPNPK